MSYKPQAFACFCPTGCVLYSALVVYQAIAFGSPASSPVVPARQAYSHSASLGKRYWQPSFCAFNFLMNYCASSGETCSTGHFSPQLLKVEGLLPFTFGYCSSSTS